LAPPGTTSEREHDADLGRDVRRLLGQAETAVELEEGTPADEPLCLADQRQLVVLALEE
jgi:hypothetical protein